MNARVVFLPSLVVALVLAIGCQGASPPAQQGALPTTQMAAQRVSTVVPTAVSSTPDSVKLQKPTITSTPTSSAGPLAVVEDCMDACHQPDPNEMIGNGANPQPASHAGRTTCLECHATLRDPVLPETHLGRLDASCTVCHK
jgi:hypothetical protein